MPFKVTSGGKLWISSFLRDVWSRMVFVGVKGSFVLHLCFSDHQTRRDWLSLWYSELEYLKAVVTYTWPNPKWKKGTTVAADSWNVMSCSFHPLATSLHWGKAYTFFSCVGVPNNRNSNHVSNVSKGQNLTPWSQAATELTEIAWCFLSEKRKPLPQD